jgi:hypothetical protein
MQRSGVPRLRVASEFAFSLRACAGQLKSQGRFAGFHG